MKNNFSRSSLFLVAIASALLFFAVPSLAQDASGAGGFNINMGSDMLSTERMFHIIVLMTVLSLAPSILVMMTSFTRIVIVFSFTRSALGLQNSPPNSVLVSLALFLTFYIMQPAFEQAYNTGIKPYIDQEVSEEEAFEKTMQPFKEFMYKNVNENDLGLFLNMLPEDERPETADSPNVVPLKALIPAFMISEIKRAFEIGFLIFLPFLVIDLAVASILMSMGMMMLPPVIVSLPFKIIFFVLVDGWHLLVGSMVESFNR